MTYADGHVLHDADSHLMEWPTWLAEHADPDVRDRVGPVEMHGMEEEALKALAAAEAARSQPLVIREDDIMRRKNWAALGAFDSAERSAALDLLGFASQLVFSTYGHLPLMRLPYSPGIADTDLLYAATRAQNRGVAEFCEDDRCTPCSRRPAGRWSSTSAAAGGWLARCTRRPGGRPRLTSGNTLPCSRR
jgi:hypothetical protein